MNMSPRAMELLAAQQKKYLQSFPAKKERIEQCWEAIQHHGWTPELTAKLKTEVHRLSGSAGSYGLDDLSKAAQALDRHLALDPHGDSEPAPKPQVPNELLHALLHQINQIIP